MIRYILSLLLVSILLTTSQAVASAFDDPCRGTTRYVVEQRATHRVIVLDLARRTPYVMPWAVGIDGNDLIGFGAAEWQSLADASRETRVALDSATPPPALETWRRDHVALLTAKIAVYERFASVDGINGLLATASGPGSDFTTWPELAAFERAGEIDAVTARRTAETCRAFKRPPWLNPDEQFEIICEGAETYMTALADAVDRATVTLDPKSGGITPQSLAEPSGTIDPLAEPHLATELASVAPPAVFTVWHTILLARLGSDVSLEVGGVPIPDVAVTDEAFDWYTNLAGYTCDGFTIEPGDDAY